MELLLQYLANGIVTGSFYALSALGLTLILGLMRVVNFAHGELYMLGGVMGWWATTRLGLDFFSGLLLVGLDVIGDCLTEINVTSPTCFVEITRQTGIMVASIFIDALEARCR